MIEVRQSDRDAAAQYTSKDYPAEIEALAAIIAAHRQQAEDAMRERCAKVAEQQYAGTPGWSGHYQNAGVCIATAIRGIDAGGEG